MNKYIKSILIPLLLVFVALVSKTMVERYYESQDNKEQEKITYVKEQLEVFYLPLKQTLHKSKISWIDYKKYYGNENVYEQISEGIDNSHTRKWQHYMQKVFRPIHNDLDKILKRRDLLVKSSSLVNKLDLLQIHIDQYKIIFAQWDNKNISENIAISHFPDDLEKSLNEELKTLLKQMD